MQLTRTTQSTKFAASSAAVNKATQSCLAPIQTNSKIGQLWRIRTVIAETGISKTEIYQKIAAGNFPTPIKLGARSVAWSSIAVQEWIQSKIQGGVQ